MDKKRIHDSLDALIDKYSGNDYVEGRLHNYIENLLPTALENAVRTHQKREERKLKLTCFKTEFTERFMHKNNYFYSQPKDLFLHYDGTHFVIYKEDDIIVIEPFESTDFIALSDAITAVVKSPGALDDKYDGKFDA